ncbi:MAG: EAL domain-containing protein [Angelakisella sp.]
MNNKDTKITTLIGNTVILIVLVEAFYYAVYHFSANGGEFLTGSLITTVCLSALFISAMEHIRISEEQASYEITTLAYYDTLTGAPNIEKFRQDARALLYKNGMTKYVLLYLDTRHFRYFNKDFGYEAGDEYLIHTANVLKKTITEDEAFARISGDLFILLHKRSSSNDLAMQYWTELRDEIINCNAVDSQYMLRLNCGAYELTRDDINIQTAIDKANIARQSLKDRYDIDIIEYNPNMQKQIDSEKEIEQYMRSALENDEFVPYMQPKYDLKNNKIVGAEALVRWIRRDGSVIPPDEFIPIFEKNGFIEDLDLYMLEQVCSHMREQLDTGVSPVPVSVNQSRCYMYNEDYVETVFAILEKYRISPPLIELEITENIAYKNMDKMVAVVEKLSEKGFLLSLDDFGAGYSSLNVLKDLRVDVLKLDRVFLGQTIDTKRGKTVVANIIRMAKELSIDVVAEGVETVEQVNFLKVANCDMAQGFYFSRPIPVQDFERILDMQRETASV